MKQISFIADENRLQKLSELGDCLERMKVIDWEMFRPSIKVALMHDKKSNAGRPPHDMIMMFKTIVLHRLYNAWANDLERGYFDMVTPDMFDAWNMHTNFHCTLATNDSCAPGMLKKTMELNPDMMWLGDVIKLYERQVQIWMNDNGRDLEAIGGGFKVTLEALQDPEKRMRIAARYKECGANADKVAEIIRIKERKKQHE